MAYKYADINFPFNGVRCYALSGTPYLIAEALRISLIKKHWPRYDERLA